MNLSRRRSRSAEVWRRIGLLLLIASGAVACRSGASVGRARSLWRMGEPEALQVARRAADEASPDDRVEARRLALEISFSLGRPDDAVVEYWKWHALVGRHDSRLVRRLARRVLTAAQHSADRHRRLRVPELIVRAGDARAAPEVFRQALADPFPEVRLAAAERLCDAPDPVLAEGLERTINGSDPRLRAAGLRALATRQQAGVTTEARAPDGKAPLTSLEAWCDRAQELSIIADSAEVRAAAITLLAAPGPDTIERGSFLSDWVEAPAGDPSRDTRAFLAGLLIERGFPRHARAIVDELLRESSGHLTGLDATRLPLIAALLTDPTDSDSELVNASLLEAIRRGGRERRALLGGLARLDLPPELPAPLQALLRTLVRDESEPGADRAAALLALVKVDQGAAKSPAKRALQSDSPTLRRAGLLALERTGALKLEDLIRLSRSNDAELRATALEAIARRGSAGLPALLAAARERGPGRALVIETLAAIDGREVREVLATVAADRRAEPKLLAAALEGLIRRPPSELAGRLVLLLREPRDDVDLLAAACLLRIDLRRREPARPTGS